LFGAIHALAYFAYYCSLSARMDKQNLFDPFTAKKAKIKIPDLAVFAADTAIPVTWWHALSYHEQDDSIAFRAAWVLEHIAAYYPERFSSVFADFLSRLPDQRNRSCQRHFTKILMIVTDPKAPDSYRDAYLQTDRERLAETVFGWLIDIGTPVAVQVNCLDILYNLIAEFDWIKDELKQQTEYLLREGSAAMQSRGKKVLAKLSKSKP